MGVLKSHDSIRVSPNIQFFEFGTFWAEVFERFDLIRFDLTLYLVSHRLIHCRLHETRLQLGLHHSDQPLPVFVRRIGNVSCSRLKDWKHDSDDNIPHDNLETSSQYANPTRSQVRASIEPEEPKSRPNPILNLYPKFYPESESRV